LPGRVLAEGVSFRNVVPPVKTVFPCGPLSPPAPLASATSFSCAFLREQMCVGGCEQIAFVIVFVSCCCEVLLSGFRVSGCEHIQEVGFVLIDTVVR
jgi:hypothetical protein